MRSYSRSTTVRTNHDRETRSCEPFEDSCGTACTGFTVRRISDHLVRRDEKVYVQLQVFAVRDIRYIRQYGNTAIRQYGTRYRAVHIKYAYESVLVLGFLPF